MSALSGLPVLHVRSVRTFGADVISNTMCALVKFDKMLIKLANYVGTELCTDFLCCRGNVPERLML
jgi:hypothetical protein